LPNISNIQLHKLTSELRTMSSGLTRRRGGGGGGGGADNEEGESSRVASPVPKPGASRDTSGPETSYESSENGHKIAFDPRDISESAERSKQPKLTLMEEVLLLGLKDKQVSSHRETHNFTYVSI
jgi:Golgi phosphoprotein 3